MLGQVNSGRTHCDWLVGLVLITSGYVWLCKLLQVWTVYDKLAEVRSGQLKLGQVRTTFSRLVHVAYVWTG